MRQCQHTGRPPHGAIGLWFARPARQRTRPPLRHHPTANLCDRPTLVCGACPLHTFCTPAAHPAPASAALAVAPQARPPNAHSRPQTNAQTNTSHKHRSPALAHGLGCRMRARHLHRASGLPHRRAHTHGPMAAPAPRHPGPVPCGRSPLPYTALYSPLSPFIVLDGTCAPQRAVGVYTFGLSMGSPGNSTGGASSGGSIGSGFGSWSLLGSLGVVAMGCTSCRRYSATSVVLASAWASKRKG